MVVHLPGEFSRGKGQRSNGGVAGEGRRQKFLRPQAKSFGGVHFTLHQSAGSFIAGTVKAARPERSQQALPLTLTSDIRH